jgi:hypothetical protein
MQPAKANRIQSHGNLAEVVRERQPFERRTWLAAFPLHERAGADEFHELRSVDHFHGGIIGQRMFPCGSLDKDSLSKRVSACDLGQPAHHRGAAGDVSAGRG